MCSYIHLWMKADAQFIEQSAFLKIYLIFGKRKRNIFILSGYHVQLISALCDILLYFLNKFCKIPSRHFHTRTFMEVRTIITYWLLLKAFDLLLCCAIRQWLRSQRLPHETDFRQTTEAAKWFSGLQQNRKKLVKAYCFCYYNIPC